MMLTVVEETTPSSNINTSLGQKRMIKRRRDQNSSVGAPLPEDLLLQIFIRLPHSKSAIRCAAACKPWLRLISSSEFIHRFQQHHHTSQVYSDSSFSHPYTFLVKFERSYDDLIRRQWSHHLDCLNSADDLLFTSRGSLPLLDFLPWDPSLSSVRAAAGDLLLVSRMVGLCCFELLLCNPLTGQCLPLPPGPVEAFSGHTTLSSPFGLARHPETKAYRVAFAHPHDYDKKMFKARIFNPGTGSWTYSLFTAPDEASCSGDYNVCADDAVAGASGILYFLLRHAVNRVRYGTITGIVAIDPFKVDGEDQRHRCRLIPMPAGFGRPTKRDVRLAVVRGRLRMSLSSYDNQDGCGGLDVRVWELRHSNDDERDDDAPATWNLVRRFSIGEEVFAVGMHPNDGDVILVLVRGNNEMCRYHIGQRKYHKFGEIPDMPQKLVKENLPMHLNAHTLLHSSPPSWPAPPLPAICNTAT